MANLEDKKDEKAEMIFIDDVSNDFDFNRFFPEISGNYSNK